MIFLTGASGLLGSYICRKLVQEGNAVRAMKRKNSNLALLQDIEAKIEWVEGDLLDILSLQEGLKGCSKIIHCAGMVSYHAKDADKLMKVNQEGTANLVNVALQQNISTFVHISSVAAIGRSAKAGKITENFKWSEADEHTAYGISKHLAEMEVFRGGVEGLEVVILNPALVLAPGPWDQSSMQVFKYVNEQRPFYTRGCMNYIDARDVANITLLALEGALKAGERYILSAGHISYRHFFELAAKYLHKKAPSVQVNSYLLQAAYYFEGLRSRLMGEQPVITKETLKLAQQQLIFDNTKIRQTLDYQFIPLEESIRWTCQQLKA
ncbi:SDR family NAD(P)-dependent oxidoreductase [Nafulsella turpanensis]|uniref:SDR family NAD(P)-dependent oxidoreductase n=1 Tax=Nafulsella turpanensis TaxID=1265690 RepID=UPI0003458192|nr:SDR family NAD(P)-dependent oxidoreductase [Nafulsella turpanensis]